MLRIARTLWRAAVRLFYFLVYAFVCGGFFASLQHYLTSGQFGFLAAIAAPTLALLSGFAALLYNRSRALFDGREKTRSLYAAERALQATLFFLFAGAIGGLGAGLPHALKTPTPPNVLEVYGLVSAFLYLACIMFAIYSFGVFYMALQTIAHSHMRWVSIRQVLRRVR